MFYDWRWDGFFFVYISLVLLSLCIYTIRHRFASGVELQGMLHRV